MVTLQDLKDKLNEIENDLPAHLDLNAIPLQYNLTDNYDDIDIKVCQYLDFYYSCIIIDGITIQQ